MLRMLGEMKPMEKKVLQLAFRYGYFRSPRNVDHQSLAGILSAETGKKCSRQTVTRYYENAMNLLGHYAIELLALPNLVE